MNTWKATVITLVSIAIVSLCIEYNPLDGFWVIFTIFIIMPNLFAWGHVLGVDLDN